MKLHLLVAFSRNRVIGKDNGIPWHIKEDMQRVRLLTTGNTIIMGEKTYQSIGRPLPNRKNIIMSDDLDFYAEGCITVHSKEEALELCKDDDDVFIFGGASIYELFLDDVEIMHITYIEHEFEGDTFFPNFDTNQFVLKYCKMFRDNVEYNYSYNILIRK